MMFSVLKSFSLTNSANNSNVHNHSIKTAYTCNDFKRLRIAHIYLPLLLIIINNINNPCITKVVFVNFLEGVCHGNSY